MSETSKEMIQKILNPSYDLGMITDDNVRPEGLQALLCMNEMYCQAMHDGAMMIMERTHDHRGAKEINAMKKRDLYDRHEADTILVKHMTQNGESWKPMPIAKYWCKWKYKNQKLKTIFSPRPLSKKVADMFFNTYPGLSKQPKKGDWSRLMFHLRNIWCNGDEELFESVMGWFAHLVQKPWEKPGVALVVTGGKGTGKSTIFECVFKPILGSLYCKVSHRSHLTGNFNAHLANKLLVVNEEAFFHGDHEASEVVKSMITEELMGVEPKGVDIRELETFMRVVFVSNNEHVVSASPDERRFLVLEISSDKAQDHDYFKALRHEISHGGIEAFLHDLLEWTIDMDKLRTPPRTEGLFKQMVNSFTPLQRWAYEGLLHIGDDHSSIKWNQRVKTADLYDHFKEWRDNLKACDVRTSANRIADPGSLTKEIRKLLKFDRTRIGNDRALFLPPRETARQMFEKNVNSKVIWDDFVLDKPTAAEVGGDIMDGFVQGEEAAIREERVSKKLERFFKERKQAYRSAGVIVGSPERVVQEDTLLAAFQVPRSPAWDGDEPAPFQLIEMFYWKG